MAVPSAISRTMPVEESRSATIDRATIAAIAIVVYALANVVHEGLGHGGACLLVGCTPQTLSSMDFAGDFTGLSRSATNLIEAGGTIANLVAGLVAFAWYARYRAASTRMRYAAWLFGTINLFQGTGYFLFSGVGNIGDWAAVIQGLQPAWAWRLGLSVIGGVTYWFAVQYALAMMTPFVGGQMPERYRRALTLMLVPYAAGAALYLVAGALNRSGGIALMAISAAASSLGGTSGLAWGPQLLRDDRLPRDDTPPAALERSAGWLAVAAVVAVVFVGVLGPGVSLGAP